MTPCNHVPPELQVHLVNVAVAVQLISSLVAKCSIISLRPDLLIQFVCNCLGDLVSVDD